MDHEIVLELGHSYEIKTVEGVKLFTLLDDGVFISLVDHTGTPVLNINKRAIPFLKVVQEERGTT